MKIRVLLVDDIPNVVKAISRRIANEFDVRLAYSGPEALATMEQSEIDVVVTDLDMPRMTGWEFIGIASRMWPETAFVVLSGNVGLRDQEAEHREMVSRVLSKPSTIDQVRNAICEAYRGRASEQTSDSAIQAAQAH
ncbi:response regulator [Aeoliella sp.]|uniref:response regulator n=1 Tax=Aeoliella sp. TaxID=2795800 RepID=UPI003CCBB28A